VLGVINFGIEQINVGDDFVDNDINVSVHVNLYEFGENFVWLLLVGAKELGTVEFF